MRSIARVRKELTQLAIEPGPGIFANAASEGNNLEQSSYVN